MWLVSLNCQGAIISQNISTSETFSPTISWSAVVLSPQVFLCFPSICVPALPSHRWKLHAQDIACSSIYLGFSSFPTPVGKWLPAVRTLSLQSPRLPRHSYNQPLIALCLQGSQPGSMSPSILYLPLTMPGRKCPLVITGGSIDNKFQSPLDLHCCSLMVFPIIAQIPFIALSGYCNHA